MKKKSPYAFGLALLLSLFIAVPTDVIAAPQAAGQRAGEVSRVIPAVSIARSGKTIAASAKTAVDWQDLVNTQVNARARIALDDGSVLNVGSESSMKIVKHDAGAQQTELELTPDKSSWVPKGSTTTIPSGRQMANGSTSCAGRNRATRWTCGASIPRADRRND